MIGDPLFMDPEHGPGFKFLQMVLTSLVTVPTFLTVFTISASMEIAGRLRGGRGLFGWLGALPWDRPMVLATGLAFAMLWLGGLGGLVNMSYGMNAMIHNTSWVTAHFHLIYGGTTVIMYFAIVYEIWPSLTGRAVRSPDAMNTQLWLWFIGMMITTVPWHWLGLQGQWRRVANFNYADPIIAGWGPWVVVSFAGGLILLLSAVLFIRNLVVLHRGRVPALARPLYALAVHQPRRVPAALNGFGLWNVLVLVLMLLALSFWGSLWGVVPSRRPLTYICIRLAPSAVATTWYQVPATGCVVLRLFTGAPSSSVIGRLMSSAKIPSSSTLAMTGPSFFTVTHAI